jgi:hypothetical protein
MGSNVLKLRRTIDGHLKRSLPSEFIVVNTPDHPFLLRSVDVLVGGKAGLTAIMAPTLAEKSSPRSFRSRFLLNKVALPPNTRFVLVATLGSEAIQAEMSREFALVLPEEGRRLFEELAAVSANPSRLDNTKIPERLLAASRARFAETFRLARAVRRRSRRHDEGLTTRELRAVPQFMTWEPRGIETQFFDTKPSPAAINKLAMKGASRWFMADNGVFPVDVPADAAFAETIPTAPGDPDKYVRAAAFAGWMLAPEAAYEYSDEISEALLRRTKLL